MAKLSKKKRAEQKRKQQNKLVSKGYSRKEVESLSNANLNKLTEYNIPQKASASITDTLKEISRKEKNREASRRYRARKKSERQAKLEQIAETLGLNPLEMKQPTAKYLDGKSLEELKKLKRTQLREFIPKDKLKPIDTFDFNKSYKLPKGKKLHFGFRALNGEKDIAKELAEFNKLSNEELISYLKTIKEMPLTSSKGSSGKVGKRVGSSGQAGEGIVRLNSQEALQEAYAIEYNDDRRSNNFAKLLSKTAKKKGVNFQHSGIDYHWQAVRQVDEHGRLRAYTEITPRKLLVIGNAILWSITESERSGFYDEFYSVCCEIIPEMKDILP